MTVSWKSREKRNLLRVKVKEELDKSRDKFTTLTDTLHRSR